MTLICELSRSLVEPDEFIEKVFVHKGIGRRDKKVHDLSENARCL